MVTEQYLNELFDPQRPLSSSKLLQLSDLSDTEMATFRTCWEQAGPQQRSMLVDRLATITEDSPEVDFNAVFRIALDDASPELRSKAVDSLWECQDRWFLNRLVGMAEDDPHETVRETAASALGKFVLLGVLEELRPSLVEQVEGALKGIINNPQGSIAVRRRAIEALGASADPDVNDTIRMAYYSDEPLLRIASLYAMGQHGDQGWLPVLLTELKNIDAAMRFEAARACGELEDARAVPSLIELTGEDDPEVQEAALEALGHIGGEEAERALRQSMALPDPRMRDAARAALEELSIDEDPFALQ